MQASTRLWVLLAGCFIASLGANAFLIAPASVVPYLVNEYAINYTQAGFAVSAAILGMVLIQLPGGLLMDRYDNRRLLFPALTVFALATLVSLFVQSFLQLLIVRLVGGMAAGLLFTVGTNIVGTVFPTDTQGFATSVFVASAPAGFAMNQATGPLVAAAFRWEFIMVHNVLISVCGFIVFRSVATDPIYTRGSRNLREMLPAFRHGAILKLSLSAFCLYATYLFLNSWLPTFATTELSLSLAGAGVTTALIPATGIFARPIGGWVSDLIGYRRRPVIVISFVGVLPLFVLIQNATTAVVYIVMLLVGGLLLQFSTGVYYTFVNELAQSGTAGTSLTIFTTISYTGSLVSPILSGWLIDAIGWEGTFSAFIGVCLAGIAFLIGVPDN